MRASSWNQISIAVFAGRPAIYKRSASARSFFIRFDDLAVLGGMALWRDNQDEKSATIWMRFFGRGDEMIVAERQQGKQDFQGCSL
jgi:hypothetical protein